MTSARRAIISCLYCPLLCLQDGDSLQKQPPPTTLQNLAVIVSLRLLTKNTLAEPHARAGRKRFPRAVAVATAELADTTVWWRDDVVLFWLLLLVSRISIPVYFQRNAVDLGVERYLPAHFPEGQCFQSPPSTTSRKASGGDPERVPFP